MHVSLSISELLTSFPGLSREGEGHVTVCPFPSLERPGNEASELHEHSYSHCPLLWCERGVVYQQVIRVLVSYH